VGAGAHLAATERHRLHDGLGCIEVALQVRRAGVRALKLRQSRTCALQLVLRLLQIGPQLLVRLARLLLLLLLLAVHLRTCVGQLAVRDGCQLLLLRQSSTHAEQLSLRVQQ
jgi:hypothetical protein